MDTLGTAKDLLGVYDNLAQETIIQFYIDDVKQAILNYCNIAVFPPELETTVVKKVVYLYKRFKQDPNVSSIKRGMDSEIKFNPIDQEDVLHDIRGQLNKFRVVKYR